MMPKRLSAATLAIPGLMAALALGACQSEAQKEVDQQAEAIEDSYEAEAALAEAVAAGTPNEAAAENRADALRAKGEKVEDHLKDMAKELDDVPNK